MQIVNVGAVFAMPYSEIEKIKKDSGEILHVYYKNGFMESYRIWGETQEQFELLESVMGGIDYFQDQNIEILITKNEGENSTGNGQTLKVLYNDNGETMLNVSSTRDKLLVEGLYLKRQHPCQGLMLIYVVDDYLWMQAYKFCNDNDNFEEL